MKVAKDEKKKKKEKERNYYGIQKRH